MSISFFSWVSHQSQSWYNWWYKLDESIPEANIFKFVLVEEDSTYKEIDVSNPEEVLDLDLLESQLEAEIEAEMRKMEQLEQDLKEQSDESSSEDLFSDVSDEETRSEESIDEISEDDLLADFVLIEDSIDFEAIIIGLSEAVQLQVSMQAMELGNLDLAARLESIRLASLR